MDRPALHSDDMIALNRLERRSDTATSNGSHPPHLESHEGFKEACTSAVHKSESLLHQGKVVRQAVEQIITEPDGKQMVVKFLNMTFYRRWRLKKGERLMVVSEKYDKKTDLCEVLFDSSTTNWEIDSTDLVPLLIEGYGVPIEQAGAFCLMRADEPDVLMRPEFAGELMANHIFVLDEKGIEHKHKLPVTTANRHFVVGIEKWRVARELR
jgi:hypothetical protein